MSSESRSFETPDSLVMAILHDLRQLGQAIVERFNKLSSRIDTLADMLKAVSGDVARHDSEIRNAYVRIAMLEQNLQAIRERQDVIDHEHLTGFRKPVPRGTA